MTGWDSAIVTRYREGRDFLVTMPAEPEPPEPSPGRARRRSPGKRDCEQCQAADGFCSAHVGYFEEVDVLASAGVTPRTREDADGMRGTWTAVTR